MRSPRVLLTLAALVAVPLALPASAQTVEIAEYGIPDDIMCKIRDAWADRIAERYPAESWVPLKWEPTDEELSWLGLPPRAVLAANEYPQPTMVFPDGSTRAVALPALAAYAGAGCLGIRPGAFLLSITDEAIGWCSMAHVYGSPGSYQISTAGHCGKVGDTATVIAAFAPGGIPILLDFGTYSKSTGDGGIGKDWALILVAPAYQHLVSPTMCAWGGPTGMFTKTGSTAALSWSGQIGRLPSLSTNPDPLLPQLVLHYGHGTGVGMGVGTPRVGVAFDWRATYFTWFGAITPGDSGSGSNTATGDTIGAVREAAGINTHIYYDGIRPFQTGTGIIASTRATLVQGTLANGQLVPYPAPVPGAP